MRLEPFRSRAFRAALAPALAAFALMADAGPPAAVAGESELSREEFDTGHRDLFLGFRVARTLAP